MKPTLPILTAALALTVLAGCGGGVHSIGVSRDCGPDASPYMSAADGIPVRCGPQVQTPWID